MMDDPMGNVLKEAEQKLIDAAISGQSHEVDDRTLHMALWSYGLRQIHASNQELATTIIESNGNAGGKKEFAKKHGPAASAGLGLGALLTFVRDYLGLGG